MTGSEKIDRVTALIESEIKKRQVCIGNRR